jgi:TMEM175 potassium channel family protein
VAYCAAFACSFVVPWVSVALFVTIAIVWVIPDRRIERVIADRL